MCCLYIHHHPTPSRSSQITWYSASWPFSTSTSLIKLYLTQVRLNPNPGLPFLPSNYLNRLGLTQDRSNSKQLGVENLDPRQGFVTYLKVFLNGKRAMSATWKPSYVVNDNLYHAAYSATYKKPKKPFLFQTYKTHWQSTAMGLSSYRVLIASNVCPLQRCQSKSCGLNVWDTNLWSKCMRYKRVVLKY